MENLKGKTAFITGGASGIGLGIAKACAEEGMNIVVVDMRQKAIDEVLPMFEENGWPAMGVKLNVTDREGYAKAVEEVRAKFGNIHLLVNNAGIGGASGPLWSVTGKDTDMALDINITGVLNGIQAIVPHMLEHGEGGHIVSTASKAALIPVPGCGLYNLSKSAVMAITETLASDLTGKNVQASVLFPGPFSSNLGMSSMEVQAEIRGEELPKMPRFEPPAPSEDAPPPPPPVDYSKIFKQPDEAGKRVVRAIKRGDIYILTHIDFKKGVEKRFDAVLRAFPEDEGNPEFVKMFGMLVDNPVFEQQTDVPPFVG